MDSGFDFRLYEINIDKPDKMRAVEFDECIDTILK